MQTEERLRLYAYPSGSMALPLCLWPSVAVLYSRPKSHLYVASLTARIEFYSSPCLRGVPRFCPEPKPFSIPSCSRDIRLALSRRRTHFAYSFSLGWHISGRVGFSPDPKDSTLRLVEHRFTGCIWSESCNESVRDVSEPSRGRCCTEGSPNF